MSDEPTVQRLAQRIPVTQRMLDEVEPSRQWVSRLMYLSNTEAFGRLTPEEAEELRAMRAASAEIDDDELVDELDAEQEADLLLYGNAYTEYKRDADGRVERRRIDPRAVRLQMVTPSATADVHGEKGFEMTEERRPGESGDERTDAEGAEERQSPSGTPGTPETAGGGEGGGTTERTEERTTERTEGAAEGGDADKGDTGQ